MLEITLRRYDAPSYRIAVIVFPAHEPDLESVLDGIGVGITTEKNCLVDRVSGDEGVLQGLTGQCINADEMQYLAKRLDSLDKNELQTFRAAVYAEQPETVKDMINLSFNLHAYTAVTDFCDISRIGKTHELSRRLSICAQEMEETDFAMIGRRLISEQKGVITPYGVLYSTGNEIQEIYSGEQFPQYSHRGDDVAIVGLEVGDYHSGIKCEYLYLPCWDVEIQKALCRLGVETIQPCVTTLDCHAMSEEVYRIFTEDYPLSEHMDTLNTLARSYTGFDDQGRDAFHAIVEMAQAKTPEDVAVLADNFYEFTVVPGLKTPTEYGRYMIIDSGHYDFDENLEEYIDFKGYGEHRIQIENGRFTNYGYIAYRGCTPAVEELLHQNDLQSMKIGGL
jgi:hypothetical protein